MITNNSRIIFITTFVVTYLTESVNCGRLSNEVRECSDNIYQEYTSNVEISYLKQHPRKMILLESFKFKLYNTLRTDEAKSYYTEVSKNIISNDTVNPRDYCEEITIGKDDGVSKYIACVEKLIEYFPDTDDPLLVLKDVYLNKVQSVFYSLNEKDYARRYYNHLIEHIGYSHQLHTPVKFCEGNIKKAKKANSKKRIAPDSKEKLKLTSSKAMKSNLTSTSGSK